MNGQSPHRPEQHSSGRGFMRLATEVLAVGFVAFNWLATQRAAMAMHYASFLSGRLIAHIYQPFGWFWWEHQWANGAVRLGTQVIFLAPIWRACEHLVMYPMLVLGGIAALTTLFVRGAQPKADLHGSATWSGTKDIKGAELL